MTQQATRPGSRAQRLQPLGADFFDRSVHQVARDLVGCRLFFEGVGGTIVETESYDRDDPACHAYVGLTERTRVLFGPPAAPTSTSPTGSTAFSTRSPNPRARRRRC